MADQPDLREMPPPAKSLDQVQIGVTTVKGGAALPGLVEGTGGRPGKAQRRHGLRVIRRYWTGRVWK